MPRQPSVFKPRTVKAPQHNARGNEATNRQRRRAMHTGSKGWRLQRERVLVRDGYACRGLIRVRNSRGEWVFKTCGAFATQVDHIHGNADEIVSDEELQSLCHACHSSKTRTEQNSHR